MHISSVTWRLIQCSAIIFSTLFGRHSLWMPSTISQGISFASSKAFCLVFLFTFIYEVLLDSCRYFFENSAILTWILRLIIFQDSRTPTADFIWNLKGFSKRYSSQSPLEISPSVPPASPWNFNGIPYRAYPGISAGVSHRTFLRYHGIFVTVSFRMPLELFAIIASSGIPRSISRIFPRDFRRICFTISTRIVPGISFNVPPRTFS